LPAFAGLFLSQKKVYDGFMSSYTVFDCGSMFPRGLKIRGNTNVVLFETNLGWALIDSGYGTEDFLRPNLVTLAFCAYVRTLRNPLLCAIHQIQAAGIAPRDVRHILLTHMHIDHAGGIADFPWSTVHVWEPELLAARHKRGKLGLGYYARQWKNHEDWQIYSQTNAEWFGMPAVQLSAFSPPVYLIPTPGHTPGHCMVAFQGQDQWILQTGSAAYPFYEQDETQQVKAPQCFKTWLMGPYLPQLKRLWCEHPGQIKFLSSHEFRRKEK
jgi:glyoxylase-like metal-dependent hydrolase (beta-lactamase superfamily II)